MIPPLISLITPCFNRARFLAETVASVAAQDFSACELIIVNDGSTDGSDQVARETAAAYPHLDVVLIDQEHQGVALARNAGIRQARGEWIILLDSDDRLAPGWLRTVERAIADHPGQTAVAGATRTFGRQESDWIVPPYDAARLALRNCLQYCTAYRRHLWTATAGYDPALPYLEDWHFWIKCLRHGLSVLSLPEPMLEYRIHDAGSLTDQVTAGGTAPLAMLVTLEPGIYDAQSLIDARGQLRAMNDHALAAVRKKIAKLPRLSMPHFWLGLALEGRGDLPGARDALTTALKLATGTTERAMLLRRQIGTCLSRLSGISADKRKKNT